MAREVSFAGLWIFTASFLVRCTGVLSHPQCVDSRPPFQTEGELGFCPEYEEFGCCTVKDDTDLQVRYQTIETAVRQADTALWSRCSEYVKTFLCQTCSPYAAHVFDSERSSFSEEFSEPRSFPGLCKSYCTQFFITCKDIVQFYMSDAASAERIKLVARMDEGVDSFCGHVGLSDVDYCYPELLTNPILTGNITLEQVTKPGCLCVETFQENQFRNPIFLKHANDGSNRMFVGEQIGLVHIMYPNGTKLPEPFLDMKVSVFTSDYKGDERGMLGMAFHPNYAENGLFYIYYSTYLESGDPFSFNHKIRVDEFKVSETNPNKADDKYRRVIIEIYEPYPNHNGGEILFGEDNYLYLSVGDGGYRDDPLRAGQDLDTLLGKVLRVDVDGSEGDTQYRIPPDNPFADGKLGRREIYAFGVRNIWRCGMDRGDRKTGYGRGRIVCGDVGQSAVEELDLLEKGANFGWNLKEGTKSFCTTCPRGLPDVNLTEPIYDYRHSVGKSITGGNFYRGCASPNLNGFYIYGDFVSGRLFRLLEDKVTKKWTNQELNMCGPDLCTPPLSNSYSTNIISFGEDQEGEIYMLSTSTPITSMYAGSVYKLVDPTRRGDPAQCGPTTSESVTSKPVTPTAAVTNPVLRTSTVSGSACITIDNFLKCIIILLLNLSWTIFS